MDMKKILGAIAILGLGILAYNQYKKHKKEKESSKLVIKTK